jgi:hypothetical protein
MKKTRFGILGAATAALLFAFASNPAKADEEFGGLPPGEGQEIVYYSCQGCHSLAIVQRSEFSRRVWDEVLEWMVDTHGMAPLPDDLYDVVLDYLVEHYGYEG